MCLELGPSLGSVFSKIVSKAKNSKVMVSTRLILYYADTNNWKHYVPQLTCIMAKSWLDRSYFHPRGEYFGTSLKSQLLGRYYYLMILLSVLCPIRPDSTQWIMMVCWRRSRADVFSLCMCDAETQFLVGWKSSQKTTKCLHLCNSVSQLGNKLGNKAILLKNASLGIRWGISEFW